MRAVEIVSTFRAPNMTDSSKASALPNPGVAAVLSFFIPGLGQFYTGRFWRGIFWLIVTPGVWLGTAHLLGWICHIIAAYTAYSYAKRLHG